MVPTCEDSPKPASVVHQEAADRNSSHLGVDLSSTRSSHLDETFLSFSAPCCPGNRKKQEVTGVKMCH